MDPRHAKAVRCWHPPAGCPNAASPGRGCFRRAAGSCTRSGELRQWTVHRFESGWGDPPLFCLFGHLCLMRQFGKVALERERNESLWKYYYSVLRTDYLRLGSRPPPREPQGALTVIAPVLTREKCSWQPIIKSVSTSRHGTENTTLGVEPQRLGKIQGGDHSLTLPFLI